MILEEYQLDITMWFENNHNTFFDGVFRLFTELGDITFLLLIFMFVYWNISKKIGLKVAFGIALSFGINTGVKEMVKTLRPFYHGEITKGLSKEVTGYSFPSGHSQNTGALWTMMMIEGQKKWINVLGIIMIIMVPLSRLYLRVHWIQDVVVGAILGISIAIIYEKFLSDLIYKCFTNSIFITFITPISFFLAVFLNNTDVAKGFGVFAGILYGFWFEMKYVGYQPMASNKAKVIRFIMGSMGLILIKTVLKIVLPDYILIDYIRYYIMGTYITFIAPYLFNKIERLR